ncbi:MAG: hypothetical protein Terrestrivirus4_93 [Terrestrivirus sp.]|jgi:hypothetical protein|uniref:Uncharacterized protein n=1 Tax=Terrestrivirus sp. TaxID=2487775 RepID=A0A3G4ZMG6_9VIRU|nr:MAG: hypothetical protein Terrestrivirus4_93 [Terrestrivirus sp.]
MDQSWEIHRAKKIGIDGLISNINLYQESYPQLCLTDAVHAVENFPLNDKYGQVFHYVKFNEVCVFGVYFVKYLTDDGQIICDYCCAQRSYIIRDSYYLTLMGTTIAAGIAGLMSGNYVLGACALSFVGMVYYRQQSNLDIDHGMLLMNFETLLRELKLIDYN